MKLILIGPPLVGKTSLLKEINSLGIKTFEADEFIKEIYVLNTLVKDQGQINIPIYMFPFKFNKLTEYIYYKENPKFVDFWENIKSEYYFFKKHRRIRSYTIDSLGKYVFV